MKHGIKYFPMSAVMDPKQRKLKVKCGLSATAVLLLVLQQIYSIEGYFCPWDEEEANTIAFENSIETEFVMKVIMTALDIGIFDKRLYKKYSVLTSEEIQTNFLEATKRRKASVIKEELLLLEINAENKNVCNSTKKSCKTEQNRIDKNRTDKRRKEQNRTDKNREDNSLEGDNASLDAAASFGAPSAFGSRSEKEISLLAGKAVESYNRLCPTLACVRSVTGSRIKAVGAIADFIEENGGFEEYFSRVSESDFLTGKNERKWKAAFDWLIRKENAVKVVEGAYDNPPEPQRENSSFDTSEFFAAALKRSKRESEERLKAMNL